MAASSGIYKSLKENEKYSPMPLVFANWNRFYIDGTTAGINIVETDWSAFNLIIEPGESGYKASDSPFLIGMKERKMSVNTGVQAMLYGDFGLLTLSGVTDISGENTGPTATVSYTVPYETERFTIAPSVGADWIGKDNTDYYYGVKNSEARSDRPAYKPEETVNGFASIDLSIDLTDRISVAGNITGTLLGKEIKNSPIVDEDYVIEGFAGLIVEFF